MPLPFHAPEFTCRVVFTPSTHPTDSSQEQSASPASARSSCRPSKGGQVVSVALEKAQVAVLAERVRTLLLALRQRGVEIGEEPSANTPQLAEPVVEEFRVGTLTLGWDADREVVVIEAREMGDDDTKKRTRTRRRRRPS